MTTAADDRATEDAFEALLAGRPAPGGAAGLAAFTGAVRSAAAAPGRPSAGLADLLSTGLLTDQPSRSAGPAPTAGTARTRRRTRRRASVIIPALIAKILSAGAVAQAAAGAGLVLAVTAGAGTAGVLPGDVQTAYSQMTGTGEKSHEPADEVLPPVEEEAGDEVDRAEVTVPEDGTEKVDAGKPTGDGPELTETQWADQGPAEDQSFGEWVSYGATRGWNHDGVVARWAEAKNQARKGQEADVEAPDVTGDRGSQDGTVEDEAGEDEAGDQRTRAGSDDGGTGTGKGGKGEGKGKDDAGGKGGNRD